MEEIIKKIYNLLCKALDKRQPYTYYFLSLNGSEPNKQIKIGNSIEYEFRNTGSTIVILNDRLKLYPAFNGRGPSSVILKTNKNEIDLTVYEYRFEIIPVNGVTQSLNGFLGWQLNNTYNADGLAVNINELQVIIKQISHDKDY